MGRDLTLYPQKASRSELKDYLESLGFVRCGHFWDWPKGTLNYSWFDSKDYRSIDGVSADVYPIRDEEKLITGNDWALHVRNLVSASWHDVSMLNEVLRGARRRFGGTIKGDYGTNKYATLWKDESTPISRGVTAVFQRVKQDMDAVRHALPDASFSSPAITPSTSKKSRDFIEFANRHDPSRVLYNGLVPFAVSMFEYFFSRLFRILITYDTFAISKRSEYKLRVDFDILLKVGKGEESIEDVIASAYTFQNLAQLNKAYIDWLKIDVRKILFKKRRIGRKVSFLENRIQEIIQYRHGVVHHFDLDRTLTQEGYLAILDAVDASITEVVMHIQNKYKVKIERY
ncbi:hypothetical protein OKA05_03015 [Luteolibacter arcticus]|uniref:RiboL-PSP-HEPN domain-containing protein n=1 Tax=Luteolibacter arcticus TaxID=1581411 RepID=A0ABT3GCZ8_9BACT|nr:hypothetical protein [Luteolibacter arcticus]MCW1921507.1 hypothetical protein [Luteolibacter arcticus]